MDYFIKKLIFNIPVHMYRDIKLFAEKAIFEGTIKFDNIGSSYMDNALYEIERLEDEETEPLVEIVVAKKPALIDCMGTMVHETIYCQFYILKEEDFDWILF
jgi:hypothetical protein